MHIKLFWWACAAMWYGLIFYMSSQNADDSSGLSLYICNFINGLLAALLGQGAFQVSEEFVRKTAHFLEYLVMGCLLMAACRGASVTQARRALLALAAGLSLSVLDEVHQFFVPGRTMRLIDMLVDMAGIGAAVVLMTGKIRRPPVFLRRDRQCIFPEGGPEGTAGRDGRVS